MKPGEEIACPNCGQNSFLVKKNKMDGWKKVGEYLACAACSFVIEEIKESADGGADADADKNLSKLKSLLDATEDDALFKNALESDINSQKSFCRDCKHFVSHPFMSRCELRKKDVSPMDDCEKFQVVQ